MNVVTSVDVTQLTLTLKMITAQVVETSVTVNNNSPIQDYVHPDDQTQPIEIIILITIIIIIIINSMQGWPYGKGLIYYRPIFWLTKLAFLRARTIPRENIF